MTPAELRTARERLGLSQLEVAQALGVDLRSYGRWERGERGVPPLLSPGAAVMVLRLHAALTATHSQEGGA